MSGGSSVVMPQEQAGNSPALRPLLVLVVDDDEVDRRTVRRGLGRTGLAVELHEAADEATARRQVNEHAYDCVFLDYNIPGSDGLRLLRTLRQESPGTPVVMLTGQGDEQVAVELMKAGAVDYLPKGSVTPERLASSVRYAVELTRASVLAQHAAEELQQSALRARFLAEASEVLTRSLDPRETIDEVARLAVPFLADYCVIYRVDDEGGPVPVAAAHHDPANQRATAAIRDGHMPDRDHPTSPVAGVIRSGELALVEKVTDAFLAEIAGSDGVLEAFRELAPACLLVLPLSARQRIRGPCPSGGPPAGRRFHRQTWSWRRTWRGARRWRLTMPGCTRRQSGPVRERSDCSGLRPPWPAPCRRTRWRR
jgi:CheY-like chemotaxis protein